MVLGFATDELLGHQAEGGGGVRCFRSYQLKEVGRAAEVAGGLDLAGEPGVAAVAFILFLTAGEAQERREVTARRNAPHADPLGVKVILLRMGAQPADSGFAVLHLGGEGSDLAVAVVYGSQGVAAPDDTSGQVVVARSGVGVEAAAVNPNHQGDTALRFGGQVEVQIQRALRSASELELAEAAGVGGKVCQGRDQAAGRDEVALAFKGKALGGAGGRRVRGRFGCHGRSSKRQQGGQNDGMAEF